MKIEQIQTSIIRLDGGTQVRETVNSAVVAEYAEAMKSGTEFPSLIVFRDGAGNYWLADGFHRLHAAREAKIDTIDCEVRPGSKRDAVLLAAGANSAHGVRRTNADKRRAVMMLLNDPEWSKWSDRKIADACAVSQPFVSAQRRSDNSYHSDTSASDSAPTLRVAQPKTETPDPAGSGRCKPKQSGASEDNIEENELGQVPTKPALVLDREGRPIPEKFRHIFAEAIESFREIESAITDLGKRVKALAEHGETGPGVHLSYQRCRANLIPLRDEVKQARPYSVCPACAGRGCETCLSLGWVNKVRYEAAGEDVIAVFASKQWGKAGGQ